MTNQRLLISLAHPDDEAFGSGGLIARYADEGTEVYYICATDGARGTIKPEILAQYGGSHKAVRYAELDCASQVLGFKEVFKFDYKDSGMMGSDENNDPDCLWQADENTVTERIVGIIRQIKPQVVLTFDPYGGYGHPDHIFIHKATTRAFHAAGDASQFPQQGTPYAPQKLYYTTFPKLMLGFFIWSVRFRGEDPRAVGTNKDLDLIATRDNALPITTKVNIRRYLDTWDAASKCHASQISPRTGIPKWLRYLLSGSQGLTRVYPQFSSGERVEKDLFQGVE